MAGQAVRLGGEVLQDVWLPEGHVLLHGRVFQSVTRLDPAQWQKNVDIITVGKNHDGAGWIVKNLISGFVGVFVVEDFVGDIHLEGRVEALSRAEWTGTITNVDCVACSASSPPPPPQDAESQRNWVHESVIKNHGVIVTQHGWFSGDEVQLQISTVTGNGFFVNMRTGAFYPVPRA